MKMTSQTHTELPSTVLAYLEQHATLIWHKQAHLPAWFNVKRAGTLTSYSPEDILSLIKAKAEGFITLELEIVPAKFIATCSAALATVLPVDRIDEQGLAEHWPWIEVTARRNLLHKYKTSSESDIIKQAVNRLPELISAPIAISGRFLIIETGLKSGLKIVCCERDGSVRSHMILFPHEPQNLWQQGIRKLDNCVATNKIETIVIITGEGYRESRVFIKQWLMQSNYHLTCYRLNGSYRKQLTDQVVAASDDTLYATVDAFIPLVVDPIMTLDHVNLKTLFHLPLLTIVSQTQLNRAIALEWSRIKNALASKKAEPDPLFLTPALRLADLQNNTSYQGQVINRTDYGYFIDIGIVENGLLHNKQVTRGAEFQTGETIEVKVLNTNPEKQQFALTMLEKPKKQPATNVGKKSRKTATNANSVMADALKAAFNKSNE